MKTAVIAPSMLYLLYPLQGEVEGYPKDKFVEDLVNECEKDIRKCFEAGAEVCSDRWNDPTLTESFADAFTLRFHSEFPLISPKAVSQLETIPRTLGLALSS
jgi:hypothetical protein